MDPRSTSTYMEPAHECSTKQHCVIIGTPPHTQHVEAWTVAFDIKMVMQYMHAAAYCFEGSECSCLRLSQK